MAYGQNKEGFAIFNKKNIFRVVAFNLLLIVVNVLLFSEPFLNIRILAGAFQAAIGITAIVVSVILFFYANYSLLKPPKPTFNAKQFRIKDIDTLEECSEAIKKYLKLKTFNSQLNKILKQIDKLKRKQDTVKSILLQHFEQNSLSYQKFCGAIDSVVDVMCLNIRSVISRITAFDEEEYILIKTDRQAVSERIRISKLNMYNEYIQFVNSAVLDNEEMIMRLDQLLLELSKLDSFSVGEIEQMDAMREIDQLISDTKWYKQS